MKKTGLWRGLSTALCFILVLSITVGNVLEANASTIDTALGTLSSQMVSDEGAGYTLFTPSAEVLNADGTGNSHALIQKAIDLNVRQAREGAVLLKNNGVLPLSEGLNVTLFGIRSHVPILGSAFGVKIWGPVVTLEQALSQNKTDFAHTMSTAQNTNRQTGETTVGPTISTDWSGDEFDFKGANWKLNQTMIDIYAKLNETYNHAHNEGALEVYDPGEPSAAEIAGVNANYKDSFAQYKDAAIVVISRPSGESHDYLPGGVVSGLGITEPLELSTNEKNAIAMAKECSDKVVVLINSSQSIEIADLKNDPEIDAILWIGVPGNYGMIGVADILTGKVSPSGGLFDIFTAKNMSAPAMQNMGLFQYSNAAEKVTRGGGGFGGSGTGYYAIEAESIYVGYRYYETRYYDSVYNQGNAKSNVGSYASNGAWDYTAEVTYGFGFGLSYTTFEMEFAEEPGIAVYSNAAGATIADAVFNVKVTNTGSVPGSTSVQIYGQAPYISGGLEKSAIQLLAYDKTGVIQPGQSETIRIAADLQYIASYDVNYDNGDGTKGAYIMDPGTYYFAVGNGAHDALNNVLAAQGKSTADGMDYNGNADLVYARNIDENLIAKTAFSISKTGAKISNALEYADWNYFQPGEVTYLSRTDWAGTWPKSYTGMTLTNAELISLLNGNYYTIKTTDDTSTIIWGKDHGIMFYEMAGLDYDNPKWDLLLEELSLEEAQYLATYGGPPIPGAQSIGTVETYMTENAGNGMAVNLNATKDPNAPWSIPESDRNGNWHPEIFGNSPLTASTFSPDFAHAQGAFVGEESLFVGIPILWGPGLNTHRHAYNGRNGEYYSEDPILSGVTAMEFAIGALDFGLIAAPKHYAFNDQETSRSGIAPWMTEQRAREVELRAYQYAFEATKYDTADYDAGMRGLMVSFSKIGPVECTCSYGLMTTILQDEWGFIGYAVTDIRDDTDLYGAVLTSGTTVYDTRGASDFYNTTTLDGSMFASQIDGSKVDANLFKGDATAQLAIKSSVHKNLYAFASSHLMNRYTSSTHVEQLPTWWRTTYKAAIYVSGGLTVVSLALYVVAKTKKKEDK